MKKLFVNMDTQEWGYFYEKPKGWAEAPQDTQVIYLNNEDKVLLFIRQAECLEIFSYMTETWGFAPFLMSDLQHEPHLTHLWGTLLEFNL